MSVRQIDSFEPCTTKVAVAMLAIVATWANLSGGPLNKASLKRDSDTT